MNRLLLIFQLLIISFGAQAQELPPPRDVDRDYRSDYRKERKEEKREQRVLERDEWDIILPPIEKVPVQQYDQLPPANADNWGVRLLLPAAVKQRISNECTYPVVLKICDTGVDVDHPDLIGAWRIPGSNYTTSPTIDDIQGHGTHVAGIATAKGFGIAHELARAGLLKLKSVKLLSDQGNGSFAWVANGYRAERPEDIETILKGGSVVYNGSFGGGTNPVPSVEAELRLSTDEGVIFLFAAGNTGGPVNYPGNSKYSITVASLDETIQRSSFSSVGPSVDQADPGRNITSTYPGGRYATLSGTSMATPFCSGLVCLALSRWGHEKLPNYNAVREYLNEIAFDLGEPGHDNEYGSGLTYVVAVLDKDPSNYIGPPDDNDPPGDGDPPNDDNPPTPPGPEKTVAKTFKGPLVLRYRTEREHQEGTGTPAGWRVLSITRIECQATARMNGESIADRIDEMFTEYWYNQGKAMVIPNNEGALESTDYAARFFYFFTKNNGFPVSVKSITAYDERGRRFEVRRSEERQGGVAADLLARMEHY